MILRCIEMKTKTNDRISLIMYFVALILWIFIVNIKGFMSLKAERFFIAFNNQTPSMIIISSILFYLVVRVCTCRYVWVAVIVISFWDVCYSHTCGTKEKKYIRICDKNWK